MTRSSLSTIEGIVGGRVSKLWFGWWGRIGQFVAGMGDKKRQHCEKKNLEDRRKCLTKELRNSIFEVQLNSVLLESPEGHKTQAIANE